jgi:hypothetical protein
MLNKKILKAKKEYQGREATGARKYFWTKPDMCVNDDDKTALELEITDEEIENALKELPSHKSPGGDGLSVDLYNKNWPNIKKIVCNSIKDALRRGELSIEHKRAVLTLVLKKDKDIRLLKN